jgi:hypothetical protein
VNDLGIGDIEHPDREDQLGLGDRVLQVEQTLLGGAPRSHKQGWRNGRSRRRDGSCLDGDCRGDRSGRGLALCPRATGGSSTETGRSYPLQGRQQERNRDQCPSPTWPLEKITLVICRCRYERTRPSHFGTWSSTPSGSRPGVTVTLRARFHLLILIFGRNRHGHPLLANGYPSTRGCRAASPTARRHCRASGIGQRLPGRVLG